MITHIYTGGALTVHDEIEKPRRRRTRHGLLKPFVVTGEKGGACILHQRSALVNTTHQ